MSTKPLSIIVAMDKKTNGIGVDGELPWCLLADLAYFSKVTMTTVNPLLRNALIMGRRTFESMNSKPLRGRLCIVLSSEKRDDGMGNGEKWCTTIDDAIKIANDDETVESVFFIGGERIYKEGLERDWTTLYLTAVEKKSTWIVGRDREYDTFFPVDMNYLTLITSTKYESPVYDSSNWSYQFKVLTKLTRRCSNEEQQYIDLVKEILTKGVQQVDRTLTGTLSVFGKSLRFSLANNSFPLLTTRRVFFRGVAEELLWFIKGSTNAKELQAKGINIWNGNSSREYLDSVGLTQNDVGDLGPVYGFQWRHFGAQYVDYNVDYNGKGIDQLKNIISTIQQTPYSRRMVMVAWNPSDLDKMALPPCHVLSQFYVRDGKLSCALYQRSADIGLGLPFNIASYSLLTIMIAHVCKLELGDFVHFIGDAHIYSDHVTALEELKDRVPRSFPTLTIRGEHDEIDGWSFDDFELHDYNPHKSISMAMSV